MLKPVFKDQLRHVLNPLHVYSRLITIAKALGIDKKSVQNACRHYEVLLYRPLLGKS